MQKQKAPSGLTPFGVLFVLILFVLAVMVILSLHRRPGGLAYRMVCGSNLAGIGKTMLIYAQDNDGELPCAGGPSASWAARTPDWTAADTAEAFGIEPDGSGGQASVSASLYLLVRYTDMQPKRFFCTRDQGAKEFRPRSYGRHDELTDFWDFGPEPPRHVSYSYHMPYGAYRLPRSDPASVPVAADRSPWIGSPFAKVRDFSQFSVDGPPYDGTTEPARAGNCLTHNSDGQNVLFLDSHVEFVRKSFCGIDDDNIYTSWDGADKMRGKPPVLGSAPADPNDSLLVNDPPGPTP